MLLLDTCTLLWLVAGSRRLSAGAVASIREHRGAIFVSAISAFEVGLKHRKGKLELPVEADLWYREALDFHGLVEIAIDGEIAARSTQLPALHADPCDRFLIATAQLHDLTLLTPDGLIAAYPDVRVAW